MQVEEETRYAQAMMRLLQAWRLGTYRPRLRGHPALHHRAGPSTSFLVRTMPIRLTPKTTIGSVMPYDLAFGLSYDAAGNAADVPIGRRGGSVPAGCPVA